MGNHCRNILTIIGPDLVVDGFIARATRGTGPSPFLDFSAFVPVDEDTYDGERDAWGVKWGAYDDRLVDNQLITKTQRRATWYFQTSICSPTVFILKVSTLYKELAFFVSWNADGPYRGRYYAVGGTLHTLADADSPDYHRPGPDYIADRKEREVAFNQWQSVYTDSHESWVEDARLVGLLEKVLAETA
jgi:hypothetical protein